MYTQTKTCRVCGSTQLEPTLDLGTQVLTGVFPKTPSQQITAGPLRLVKCMGPCGLLQLEHSYSLPEMYGDNYGYRSGLNASMTRHLREKVARVLNLAPPAPGSVVLDIGSNDGTTLSAYPDGLYRRVGIDPTSAKFRDYYPRDVVVVADFFSASTFRAAVGADSAAVVTSFSMLYDLERPLDFMRDVHSILANDGVWVFEQSYMPLMLERNAYDTVCHEHLEYYAFTQIHWMLEQVGFKAIDIEFNDVNGGSFSVTAAKTSSPRPESPLVPDLLRREGELGLRDLAIYASFAERVSRLRDGLRAFVAKAKSEQKVIAGLGASTKGNVTLQYCGFTGKEIKCIGEVNAEKFGAFTPGSLIPIVPESSLLAEGPDYLLILPWHFRETFLRLRRKETTRLLFPMPTLEVV